MTPLEILAAVGLVLAFAAIVYIAVSKPEIGSPLLAGILFIGFTGYTVATLVQDGLLFWPNHTTNMTGVQVWWDLLLSVVIAAFFIAPRARAQGMLIVPWLVFVAATASIGLLAMIARLFWLEKQHSG